MGVSAVGSPDPRHRYNGCRRGFPAQHRPPLSDVQHQWSAKECVGQGGIQKIRQLSQQQCTDSRARVISKLRAGHIPPLPAPCARLRPPCTPWSRRGPRAGSLHTVHEQAWLAKWVRMAERGKGHVAHLPAPCVRLRPPCTPWTRRGPRAGSLYAAYKQAWWVRMVGWHTVALWVGSAGVPACRM